MQPVIEVLESSEQDAVDPADELAERTQELSLLQERQEILEGSGPLEITFCNILLIPLQLPKTTGNYLRLCQSHCHPCTRAPSTDTDS